MKQELYSDLMFLAGSNENLIQSQELYAWLISKNTYNIETSKKFRERCLKKKKAFDKLRRSFPTEIKSSTLDSTIRTCAALKSQPLVTQTPIITEPQLSVQYLQPKSKQCEKLFASSLHSLLPILTYEGQNHKQIALQVKVQEKVQEKVQKKVQEKVQNKIQEKAQEKVKNRQQKISIVDMSSYMQESKKTSKDYRENYFMFLSKNAKENEKKQRRNINKTEKEGAESSNDRSVSVIDMILKEETNRSIKPKQNSKGNMFPKSIWVRESCASDYRLPHIKMRKQIQRSQKQTEEGYVDETGRLARSIHKVRNARMMDGRRRLRVMLSINAFAFEYKV